jgi:hypothetical protein
MKLNMRRQVRRTGRQPHCFDTGLRQDDPERLRELCVAIHQQVLLSTQESPFGIGEVPCDLEHPFPIGIRGAPAKCTRRVANSMT